MNPTRLFSPASLDARTQMMAIAQASGGGIGAGAMGANMEPWPGLAMSRCIGHQGVAKIGIVADPTCANRTLTDDDKV